MIDRNGALLKLSVTVRSLDPGKLTPIVVGEIERGQSELVSALAEFSAEEAVIERDKTFLFPGTEVVVGITVGFATGLAEAAGKAAGERALTWIRTNWPNADVEIIQLHLSDAPSEGAK